MIIETSSSDYLSLFKKKFLSFCERSPIYISFSTSFEKVFLYVFPHKKTIEFDIDENIKVEDFIGIIKKSIKEKYYPRLIKENIVFYEPSIADLDNYIEKHNCSLKEAFKTLSYKVESELFIIEKINLKKNQMIIEDRDKNHHIYEMKIPITVFLKKYFFYPVEGWKVFNENSKFLYSVSKKEVL